MSRIQERSKGNAEQLRLFRLPTRLSHAALAKRANRKVRHRGGVSGWGSVRGAWAMRPGRRPFSPTSWPPRLFAPNNRSVSARRQLLDQSSRVEAFPGVARLCLEWLLVESDEQVCVSSLRTGLVPTRSGNGDRFTSQAAYHVSAAWCSSVVLEVCTESPIGGHQPQQIARALCCLSVVREHHRRIGRRHDRTEPLLRKLRTRLARTGRVVKRRSPPNSAHPPPR